MEKLTIELCPETGICSIVKNDGSKIDLMPDEVDGLRKASGNPSAVKQVIGEVDSSFADTLNTEELKQLSSELK
jgi:hypothetical protein